MFHLAHVYTDGIHVARDPAQGASWMRRAEQRTIDTGDHETMVAIATRHYFGDGRHHDPARAIEWIRRAPAADHPRGNLWLGRAYLDGVGVERDPRTAIRHLERSLAQGVDAAMPWLATAHILLGEKERAAYYLRSVPAWSDVLGTLAEDWFERLGVTVCGPRAKLEPVAC